MDTLYLDAEAALEVRVHPVVLFSILDHHLRRHEGQSRVIGTLLGSVSGGVVEVTNSFAVPHMEKGSGRSLQLQVSTMSSMKALALHSRVNPSEVVVGWYATSVSAPYISEMTCAINNMYAKQVARPVHLVVDLSMSSPRIVMKSFVCRNNRLLNKVAVQFQEARLAIAASEAEKIGVDVMLKGKAADDAGDLKSLSTDMDSLETSIERLLDLLDTCKAYVDDVVAGKRPADLTIGRAIADTLAEVPRIDPAAFDRLFHNSLQDLLMVVYLSNLTHTQLVLAEQIKSRAAS